MHGMPRLASWRASASCRRFVLLLTLRKRGMSWLSTKVTRSLAQVKLPFSAVSVLSISLKALFEAKTSRMAVFSGMSLLDFPLHTAIRDVFASNNAFSEIDSTLTAENGNFTWANDLVTFVDNHDMPRFLSVNNNTNRLHEALALQLASRGIPCIYYGDEQYLHNDTSGGGDPYNRPMMASFSTTTTAYSLIHSLATLRQQNPALAYGTTRERWINSDVYIFERQFFNDGVLMAVN